jgi:hypothetical protein
MTERPGNEIRNAWEDVSERLTVWGRLVAERYRETEPASGATTPEDARKLEDTARDLGEQLNRAFTAFGDTLRDEEAKAQLRSAMKAFGDAVSLTVNETADEIRRRVGSTSHDATDVSNEPTSTQNGSSTANDSTRDDIPPPPASA